MNGATCSFCDRMFRNRQAVRAHLKACPTYRQVPKATVPTLGSKPRTPSLGDRHAGTRSSPTAMPKEDGPRRQPPRGAPDPDQAPFAKELRRLTIQSIKKEVIDSGWLIGQTVPAEAKAQALVAIEQELSRLPADQLPRSELVAIAEGIRDRIYKPVLQAQQRARAEEDRTRKQAWLQATLIAVGVARAARTLRQQEDLDGLTRLDLEHQVKRALDQEIDGSESEADVETLIDRFVTKQLEPIQTKRRARIRQQLIDHGKAYVARELASEEDLDTWERRSIERDVKRDLEEQVTGDESESDVEVFVDEVLDHELGETEEEDED
jgi:hypothetical protein